MVARKPRVVSAAVLTTGVFAWLGFAIALAGCDGQRDDPESAAEQAAGAQATDPVERGAYLVQIAACHDCHTPFVMGERGPEPDMSRMLSGHPADLKLPPPPRLPQEWPWVGSATNTAFAGPWGTSYAINLTPDDTGLGTWSEQVFVNAIRKGQHLGVGRPILPPMPWPMYAHMTDEDLRAVFAYLRSVPPIQNQAPESVPAKQ
jgi:hypothetical protein